MPNRASVNVQYSLGSWLGSALTQLPLSLVELFDSVGLLGPVSHSSSPPLPPLYASILPTLLFPQVTAPATCTVLKWVKSIFQNKKLDKKHFEPYRRIKCRLLPSRNLIILIRMVPHSSTAPHSLGLEVLALGL